MMEPPTVAGLLAADRRGIDAVLRLVALEGCFDRFCVSVAGGLGGALRRPAKREEDDAGQDPQDGDDDHQLNEREAWL